jgi:hypothetical protein
MDRQDGMRGGWLDEVGEGEVMMDQMLLKKRLLRRREERRDGPVRAIKTKTIFGLAGKAGL